LRILMLGLARKLTLRASGGSVSLSSCTLLYTDTSLVLDASTRVAAAAGSGLIDLHLHCVVDLADGRIHRAHARCCEEADLASLGWICVAEQRCTDAAPVLDASTRVAAAARSGLIDLHFAFVVDHADGSQAYLRPPL
jgi:hypothetical protein